MIHAVHQQRKRRRKEEESRHRQAEWERTRQEKLRLIEAEEARIQGLLTEADDWHRSNRIRRYIAAVQGRAIQTGGYGPGSGLDEWGVWATQQADRIDPLVDAPARSSTRSTSTSIDGLGEVNHAARNRRRGIRIAAQF